MQEQPENAILKDNGDGYLSITEQSIEKVEPFSCLTLNEAGQQALAQAHRELLQEAAAHPAGTETARCYGLDMRAVGETIIGDRQEGVQIPDQDVPYIAAHTHPSGMTFSPADIRLFAKRSNMRMLTAVGNNGIVYAVEKTPQFDKKGMLALFRGAEARLAQLNDLQKVNATMQQLLREAKQYGANFYAGRDR